MHFRNGERPFYQLHRPLFENTHHDVQGLLQLEETHACAFGTFVGIEHLCILDFQISSH